MHSQLFLIVFSCCCCILLADPTAPSNWPKPTAPSNWPKPTAPSNGPKPTAPSNWPNPGPAAQNSGPRTTPQEDKDAENKDKDDNKTGGSSTAAPPTNIPDEVEKALIKYGLTSDKLAETVVNALSKNTRQLQILDQAINRAALNG
ncbi:uncharacterized protein LOC117789054 [Drosophila innubila]|uniref:uncharacterized protein LOC117789054 n=1 Tax=Drosophila innubila TaxID=198719 RepID=UPI00148E7DC5|nr:uncharacterized protein LOC117789054 [Drosophila innubila]